MEAPPRFLAPELAEAFRRTPSPRLDEDFPQVLPCFRLMLPDGALFTEDKVPIPVVIVADLRAMADWLPPQAQRIGGISHPAWQWDEQAVQSTNQRMEGLAINALLVQLYQPELLTTGPAAKVRSGRGFAGAADPAGTVSPQGPVWIGKDFRLDRSPRAATPGTQPAVMASVPPAGPIGAAATGKPCCMARSARAAGCSGFSGCMWG